MLNELFDTHMGPHTDLCGVSKTGKYKRNQII